jgi:anti-anti-sigma factor
MTDVGYISSTGVGALAQLLSAAAQRSVPFRLRNLSPRCEAIFSTLGLLAFFNTEKEGSGCPE